MIEQPTILIFCGEDRHWSDSEIKTLGSNNYKWLLLDTMNNEKNWEEHSIDFIRQAKDVLDDVPLTYVASWGNETVSWTDSLFHYLGDSFKGLYWNNENPARFPPSDLHECQYTLWIPYSAGAIKGENIMSWGLGNMFKFLDGCKFPNQNICVQPNVYQLRYSRDFWDMVRIYWYARKYNIKLEYEFDENLYKSMKYYRWLDYISPNIFTCVYGGYKTILDINEVV